MYNPHQSAELAIQLAKEFTKFDLSITVKSNKPELVYPRQIAHWLMKKNTKNSSRIIGSLIGNKNHATVLHSIKTIDGYMQVNPTLRKQLTELSKAYNTKIKQENFSDVDSVLEEFAKGMITKYEALTLIQQIYDN